jgi:hypothetical protein
VVDYLQHLAAKHPPALSTTTTTTTPLSCNSSSNNNNNNCSCCSGNPTVSIQTQIFDLWHDSWKCMAEEEWYHQQDLKNNINMALSPLLTWHAADLRLPFQAIINHNLALAIPNADLIVAQYVLHENASYLLTTIVNKKTLCPETSLMNVLQCAKIGAIMVCTDSIHTLWPIMQSAASELGWISQSNLDQDHPIIMGPTSYLLLMRKSVSSINL